MTELHTLLHQHPRPTHTILHISDTHFVEDGATLYGVVNPDDHLRQLFDGLADSAIRPDALVFTGDLTDNGQVDGYRRLRTIVEPVCEAYGAQLIWVMGNHDARPEFRRHLLDEIGADPATAWANIDYVADVNGLRVIALDSTVPGQNHGEIDDAQHAWLAQTLQQPAEHGTLVAMHHPPVPTHIDVLRLVELREQSRFEETINGTDVRAVLAGHFHYSSASTLPDGTPVSVAAATCFSHDTRSPAERLHSRDGALGCNLVEVYPDRIVHTVVPLGAFPKINETSLYDLYPGE